MNNYDNAIENMSIKYKIEDIKESLKDYKINLYYSNSDENNRYLNSDMLYGAYRLAHLFNVSDFIKACNKNIDVYNLILFNEEYKKHPELLWQNCFESDIEKFINKENIDGTLVRLISYDRINKITHDRPHSSYIINTTEIDNNYYIQNIMMHYSGYVVRIYPNNITISNFNTINGRPRVVIEIKLNNESINYDIKYGTGILRSPDNDKNTNVINDIQAIVYCITNGQYIPFIERMKKPYFKYRFKMYNYFGANTFYKFYEKEIPEYIASIDNIRKSFTELDKYSALDTIIFRKFVSNCIKFYSENKSIDKNLMIQYIIDKLLTAVKYRLKYSETNQTKKFIKHIIATECINTIQRAFKLNPFNNSMLNGIIQLNKINKYLSNEELEEIIKIYKVKRPIWANQSSIVIPPKNFTIA